MITIGVVAAAAATWVAAPFVVMNRRGTLVQQQREAIRAETRRLEAARRSEEAVIGSVIPMPRRSSEPTGSAVTPLPQRIAD